MCFLFYVWRINEQKWQYLQQLSTIYLQYKLVVNIIIET